MSDLPVQVRALAGTFLREVDESLPGLVTGFYLIGSVALDDYRPGISDVDFLAITARRPDRDDVPVLADIHRSMPKTPPFDGIYLDADGVAARPDDGEIVPHAFGGEFRTSRPCGELNPMLWQVLTRRGITVRGPSAREFAKPDVERVRTWNLTTLKTYWRNLADRLRDAMAGRDLVEPAPADRVMWAVLGPPRLHYALATGEVISKTGAGHYAAARLPSWAWLAELAVSCREGGPVEFTASDALAAADMAEAVVDDAWLRFA